MPSGQHESLMEMGCHYRVKAAETVIPFCALSVCADPALVARNPR